MYNKDFISPKISRKKLNIFSTPNPSWNNVRLRAIHFVMNPGWKICGHKKRLVKTNLISTHIFTLLFLLIIDHSDAWKKKKNMSFQKQGQNIRILFTISTVILIFWSSNLMMS